MERAIDQQKLKTDPNYKGAFHEKKSFKSKIKQKKTKRPPKYTGKTNSGYVSKIKKVKNSSKRGRHKK
jgi:ATP-dependent RNA helicase RhlE